MIIVYDIKKKEFTQHLISKMVISLDGIPKKGKLYSCQKMRNVEQEYIKTWTFDKYI